MKNTETRRRRRFVFPLCLSLYLLLLAGAACYGLTLFWEWADAYEQARPHHAMDAFMEETDTDGWRSLLAEYGVSESYMDSLALDDATCVKKLGVYTDEAPVYSIRFGKKEMFVITLEPGEALPYGYHRWQLGSKEIVKSGLTVYAPEGAVITAGDERIGEEYLLEQDAQPVTLSVFEENLRGLSGLSKYGIDHIFDDTNLSVTDSAGNPLPLSHAGNNAYYYAPLMGDYTITAPSCVTVAVNGIVLTEENSTITRTPLDDFKGLESFLPVPPDLVTYQVEGLVQRPVVSAGIPENIPLAASEDGSSFSFALLHDEALAAEQEDYLMRMFDAYIAFSGNRYGNLYGNYYVYNQFLMPGSEPADRAVMSLASLTWAVGRANAFESAEIGEVIRYSDELFTCRIDFSLRTDESKNSNSLLFIFMPDETGQWKVVQLLNKTSFLSQK